jgi:hypothetical protein
MHVDAATTLVWNGEPVSDQLLGDEIRNRASPAFAAWLREDDQLDAWSFELANIKRDIENQLIERDADLAAFQAEARKRGTDGLDALYDSSAEFKTWRAGAVRFKSHVERRLQECKTLRRKRDDLRNAQRSIPQATIDALVDHVSSLASTVQHLSQRVGKLEQSAVASVDDDA